jgi:uncharacterized protein (DUF1330 family)
MAYEIIVAMNVTDETGYRRYREGMLPILESYGGGFRHDFVVSRVLASAATHPVTRVFAIYFRDEAASAAFFADPAYKAVRARDFDGSVNGFTQIASYDRP